MISNAVSHLMQPQRHWRSRDLKMVPIHQAMERKTQRNQFVVGSAACDP